jgi:hypothetical protein
MQSKNVLILVNSWFFQQRYRLLIYFLWLIIFTIQKRISSFDHER